MVKKLLMVALCLLIPFSLVAEEVQKNDQNIEKQYETIVASIKDKPKQAIKDLKKLADKNNSAALEYLLLLSIYEPQKTNTPEFAKIAARLHNAITQQYEKIVPTQPFFRMYQDIYMDLIQDDYLKCYQNVSCLINVGAYNFSKFFSIWDHRSTDMLYVPWKIVVPCPVAQKFHLTTIMDVAGGGHGAEALDISNCSQYSKYRFPSAVEEYRQYIQGELELRSSGSIRFLYAAHDTHKNILNHYDPDWNLENADFPAEFLQAFPLESWAMESYPNYMYFSKIINHGIGFNRAVDNLTQHYLKTFPVDEQSARRYARYVMTPRAAKSLPVNKETLRYKILSNVSAAQLKEWIEEKKLRGEEFAEPDVPHLRDEILMVSIHRPDVLKMLIETCPGNEEKLNCIGLNTDVDAVNPFGKTALMYAAQYGFLESVKILLDAGADINAQTNDGKSDDKYCWEEICIVNGNRTALMYAVQEGHLDVAEYLVKNGAEITLKDSKGMTVYDYLSGAAPYLGNFRPSPTGVSSFFPPEKHENKNITAEQSDEFRTFLITQQNSVTGMSKKNLIDIPQ